MQGMLSKR